MFDYDLALITMQESVNSLARAGTIDSAFDLTPATQLLGPDSLLDSIGFVTFVTDIEDRMQAHLDKECYFVLNQINQFDVNSPILTVDSLAKYMVQLAVD